jgi:hypothetical protein
VNPFSAPDESKLLPLVGGCSEEARIPNQRNRDASAVDQVHDQSLVSQLRSDGPQRRFIDYQSSHPTLSGTFAHFLQQSFGCPGVGFQGYRQAKNHTARVEGGAALIFSNKRAIAVFVS